MLACTILMYVVQYQATDTLLCNTRESVPEFLQQFSKFLRVYGERPEALKVMEKVTTVLPTPVAAAFCDAYAPESRFWRAGVVGLLSHPKDQVLPLIVGGFHKFSPQAKAFLYYQFEVAGWPELLPFASKDEHSKAPVEFMNPTFRSDYTLGYFASRYMRLSGLPRELYDPRPSPTKAGGVLQDR